MAATSLAGTLPMFSQKEKSGLLARLRHKAGARKHMKLRTAIFAVSTLEDLVEFHVKRALEYVKEFKDEAPVDKLIWQYIDVVGVGMNLREGGRRCSGTPWPRLTTRRSGRCPSRS